MGTTVRVISMARGSTVIGAFGADVNSMVAVTSAAGGTFTADAISMVDMNSMVAVASTVVAGSTGAAGANRVSSPSIR